MVVKERIIVDLNFKEVNTCVETVKEWFKSKGYKKFDARNPDRWSSMVVMTIAKGGLRSKAHMQATFKSHMGGHSIMIEFVGSHEGQGIGNKPIKGRGKDPKDKPYENIANDLFRFVKKTWKRDVGTQADPVPTTPTTGWGPICGASTGSTE